MYLTRRKSIGTMKLFTLDLESAAKLGETRYWRNRSRHFHVRFLLSRGKRREKEERKRGRERGRKTHRESPLREIFLHSREDCIDPRANRESGASRRCNVRIKCSQITHEILKEKKQQVSISLALRRRC